MQHLLQAQRVAHNHQRGGAHVGHHKMRQVQRGLHFFDHLARQPGNVEALRVDAQPPLRDARDVEQIVDHALQAARLADQHVQRFGVGGRNACVLAVEAALEQLGIAEHRGERGFQLVRGHRQELVAQAQRLLCFGKRGLLALQQLAGFGVVERHADQPVGRAVAAAHRLAGDANKVDRAVGPVHFDLAIVRLGLGNGLLHQREEIGLLAGFNALGEVRELHLGIGREVKVQLAAGRAGERAGRKIPLPRAHVRGFKRHFELLAALREGVGNLVALGDVDIHANHALGRALRVEDHVAFGEHPALGAVGPADAELNIVGRAAGQGRGQVGLGGGAVVGVDALGPVFVLALEAAGRQAIQHLELGRPDNAIFLHQPLKGANAAGALRKRKALGAGAQQVFAALALGDVGDDRAHVVHRAGVGLDHRVEAGEPRALRARRGRCFAGDLHIHHWRAGGEDRVEQRADGYGVVGQQLFERAVQVRLGRDAVHRGQKTIDLDISVLAVEEGQPDRRIFQQRVEAGALGGELRGHVGKRVLRVFYGRVVERQQQQGRRAGRPQRARVDAHAPTLQVVQVGAGGGVGRGLGLLNHAGDRGRVPLRAMQLAQVLAGPRGRLAGHAGKCRVAGQHLALLVQQQHRLVRNRKKKLYKGRHAAWAGGRFVCCSVVRHTLETMCTCSDVPVFALMQVSRQGWQARSFESRIVSFVLRPILRGCVPLWWHFPVVRHSPTSTATRCQALFM